MSESESLRDKEAKGECDSKQPGVQSKDSKSNSDQEGTNVNSANPSPSPAPTPALSLKPVKQEPAMAKPVLNQTEIGRFVDLGLGRGVDATSAFPWKNKSSFQVRYPTYETLIGTEEGGYIHSYKSDATSTLDLQTEVKVSLYIPNTPVSIGVANEMSRSSALTTKIVGHKVVNRTISFRLDVMESPTCTNPPPPSKPEAACKENNKDDDQSFEEIISRWILNRIRFHSPDQLNALTDNPINQLSDFIEKNDEDTAAKIVEDCADFIKEYGITHYVSSITLGALEHTVMTESQYEASVQSGVDITASDIFEVNAPNLTYRRHVNRATSSTKKIGEIDLVTKKVERGSLGEAVIEIKLLPIHSLISRNRLIYLSLHEALVEYTKKKAISSTGPFLIECGDTGKFWEVDKESLELTITESKDEASVFYILPCDDTKDSYDFNIGWKRETQKNINEQPSGTESKGGIMRYLEVKTSVFGNNPDSLMMKSELRAKHSRLCLYSQLTRRYFQSKAEIVPWLEGEKAFFIRNSRRKRFIAADFGLESFKCISSQDLHDEKNTWMIFRLVTLKPKQVASFNERIRKTSLMKEGEKLRKELHDLVEKN